MTYDAPRLHARHRRGRARRLRALARRAAHRLRRRVPRLGLPRGRRRERHRRRRAHLAGRDVSTHSALYDAVLEHERYAPAHNAFRYRIYQLLLDLDELDELSADIPFLSFDRRNLVEVRAADHLGDPRLSIRDNVRTWLDSRGVERARRTHRAAHARAHVRVRLQSRLLLLRAQPRRHARVRRGRGAQHVRGALAVPARRARTSSTGTAACASAPRSASTSRRSWTSRARTASCSASRASA